MKRSVLSILITGLCFFACQSLSQAQSLEVHEAGTGTGTVSHWESAWGSYDRDYHQTKVLRITVNDVSRRAAGARVYVYFIGRKQPQLDLFVYNHVALTVDFGGKIQAVDEIAAPSLFLNEKHYASLNRHYSNGASMEGWIAVGRVGTRVFGTSASNQNLLAIANSDRLSTMIAAAGIRDEAPSEVKAQSEKSQPTAAASIVTSAISPSIPPKLATITKPVAIPVPYGSVQLAVGTKLSYAARSQNTVRVRYMGAEYDVPITSTDVQ